MHDLIIFNHTHVTLCNNYISMLIGYICRVASYPTAQCMRMRRRLDTVMVMTIVWVTWPRILTLFIAHA